MRFLYFILALEHTREGFSAMRALEKLLIHTIDTSSVFMNEETQNEILQLIKGTAYCRALARLTVYLDPFEFDYQHLGPLLEQCWTLAHHYYELWLESNKKRYEKYRSQGQEESGAAVSCRKFIAELEHVVAVCKEGKRRVQQSQRYIDDEPKGLTVSSFWDETCLCASQHFKAKSE